MKYYITYKIEGIFTDTLCRAVVTSEEGETLEDIINELEIREKAIIINVIELGKVNTKN